MKKVITACGLMLSLCLFQQALGATRFWVATTASNWNNTANWSNVSGGAGRLSVPVAADDANFDNNGVGNCTIDVAINVRSITEAAGFTGIIIQGVNQISTINAATFAGGTYSSGSANIKVGGNFTLSGTAFTSTSAVLELDNPTAAFTNAGFVDNNGTVRLNSATGQTISGISPVFFNLEFAGVGNTYSITSAGDTTVLNSLNFTGTQFYNVNTGTIDVKRDINSSNRNNGSSGTALININGTINQNFIGNAVTAGVGALPQVTINKT